VNSEDNKATRKEWLGLVILILPTLIVSMDMTVTYLALPVLSASLHPTSVQLLWITDIYGFLEAGMLILMGTLSDRLGVRKVLLSGGTVFAAASAAAAFSPSAIWLILARAVMGIAGAALLPSVLSLIRNMFRDNTQRIFAMGLYTTCFSAGIMLGPIIGGFLLNHFWWGSIFLIPAPLIIMLLLTARLFLPEFKNLNSQPVEFSGAAMMTTAILLTVLGIKQIASNGLWPFILVVACGGALLFFFIRSQKSAIHPLIDLNLFKKAAFNVPLLCLFIALFSWSGIFLFVGQYLQSVVGFDSFRAGLWMLPGAVGSILLCMLAPVAAKHFTGERSVIFGLLMMAAGCSLLTQLSVGSLTVLVISIFLVSAGSGLTVTLCIDMVVTSAPPGRAGSAAGISETSTAFGGSFGIAILGSIWSFFYRRNMNGNEEAARNTIAGAVAAQKKLPQSDILRQAREVFVHALHITAVVATGIILFTVVITLQNIKKIRHAL
jgi:MFS transporter, DHA2 family, multidrug resistance protein